LCRAAAFSLFAINRKAIAAEFESLNRIFKQESIVCPDHRLQTIAALAVSRVIYKGGSGLLINPCFAAGWGE
jgi:hypothetical protein